MPLYFATKDVCPLRVSSTRFRLLEIEPDIPSTSRSCSEEPTQLLTGSEHLCGRWVQHSFFHWILRQDQYALRWRKTSKTVRASIPLRVQQQRSVDRIPKIEVDAAIHQIQCRRFAAQPIHLCPTGDTRFDALPDFVVLDRLGIKFVMGLGMRPRPTSDIWPINTLISCGNWSMLVLRRNRPTRVMRASPWQA